ncbi:MAG: hypothetical protein R6U98_24020 [Pirellulaceae bacterium]
MGAFAGGFQWRRHGLRCLAGLAARSATSAREGTCLSRKVKSVVASFADYVRDMDAFHQVRRPRLDTVRRYDELFCHVVGSRASMGEAAKRMEASQLKGAAASRRVFK